MKKIIEDETCYDARKLQDQSKKKMEIVLLEFDHQKMPGDKAFQQKFRQKLMDGMTKEWDDVRAKFELKIVSSQRATGLLAETNTIKNFQKIYQDKLDKLRAGKKGSKVETGITDQLNCPICFEIPLKEIYQCENGHTFCDDCAKRITNMCPQCRTSLGNKKIRNRAMEALLDVMKFDCSFQVQGCTEKVSRKEIESHKAGCKFGGENVLLCYLMEYDCDYVTNSRRLDEAVSHLVDQHNCLYTYEEEIHVTLNGIAKFMLGQTTPWEPIIFGLAEAKIILLVKSQLNTISFNCIGLGDQSNQWKIQFGIVGKSAEIPPLKWSVTPVDYLKLKTLACVLPYQFSSELLKENYTTNDNLSLRICAYKDPSSNLVGSSNFAGLVTNISISPRK